MLEYGEEQDFKYIVNIKVIGVGGGGNNAVRHMMNSDMRGIDFWVANTDSQSLGAFNKENRIYFSHNPHPKRLLFSHFPIYSSDVFIKQ